MARRRPAGRAEMIAGGRSAVNSDKGAIHAVRRPVLVRELTPAAGLNRRSPLSRSQTSIGKRPASPNIFKMKSWTR